MPSPQESAPAPPVRAPRSSTGSASSPANPVVVESWRGGAVESQHRGSWILCDGSGQILEGAGDWETPVYARSSIKALQALPLVETGAADRFGFDPAELALAVSSHNAERCHTEAVERILARLELDQGALQCGSQRSSDPTVRFEMRRDGEAPSALHNNCSGKHAGFLALTRHLGAPVEEYLAPHGATQTPVRAAVSEVTGYDLSGAEAGVDGCSAPTFRIPLWQLATGFARFATPGDLGAERAAACRRIADAVAAHPVMMAGTFERIDTDIAAATGGRLFPKIGAEAVYVIGVRDADRGLAVKVDDGGPRGLHALVMGLLEHLGLAEEAELERLGTWRDRVLKNRSGLEVGRLEVKLP